MPTFEHRAQIPPRELRHETVLTFLGYDAASATAVGLDRPAVVRAQHAARVPSEFARRLEDDHAAGYGGAKRLPLEFSIGREIGRISAKEIYIGAIAVPFGPFGSAD